MIRGILLLLILVITTFSFAENDTLTNWKFRLDLPPGHHLPSPSYPATVPGVVHLDLMNNGLVPDFYADNNEHSMEARRLETEDWVYTTFFDLTPEQLNQQHLELVFEGLDTYARVYLNDSLILTADNMFRSWVIPIEKRVRAEKNELRVHFTTPLNYHENTVMHAPYELPSGNETVAIKVAAYTRKAAYQFGWDWGPRFVTCGIWKPCYIRSWNNFRITDFYAETVSLNDSNALMQFHFTLESDQSYNDPFQVEFMGKKFTTYIKKGKKQVDFYHEVKEAKLWYPNGHGDHPMYSSTLNIYNLAGEKVQDAPVHFAIRTIELVNKKDSIGTSFYFKVNGKPIFMKGANYIPQDLFLPRVTEEQTENLLAKVQECGMNMIRVWGGGIYESDFFYDQCDLRGILVWQDFMFANSMYPSTPEFHENVAAEVEENVMRLRNHPCIALWCGNNEIEVAWHNWGWQKQYGYSPKDSTEIWKNYVAIFHQLIPEKLQKLDPSRAYISSSPQSNWGKAENFNHGAMHYWGVWHGKEPIENFKNNVGRFMVEYGFQSYPEWDLFYQYFSQENLNSNSEAFKNRQKSYIGNELIDAELKKYNIPPGFSDTLYATQIIQYDALKTAIVAHRFAAPHCMGTLFWQLNDCWPGPSWSVLDYNQSFKESYFAVEKWFSPTIALLESENDSLKLTVHSENPVNGKVILTFQEEEFGETFKTLEIPYALQTLETKQIWFAPLKKYRKKYKLENLVIDVAVYDLAEQLLFSDTFRFSQQMERTRQ